MMNKKTVLLAIALCLCSVVGYTVGLEVMDVDFWIGLMHLWGA